ncbi:MAG: hypothetical protein IJZ37_04720 [Clostridia bacterium]|nr:hypothetical protein [Clostridia bacterium]MBQ8235971.1 hypothetical protein [Clostridia bacterium]MBQ8399094.1 hypothetical protein [Clostridia bacterium]
MFKILPMQSIDERRALCQRTGAEFYPGDLAYQAFIDEKEAGIITFFFSGKRGCLRQICFYPDMQDFEVMFIGGRACMNFMDSVGATEGYFISPDPSNERLTLALGYKKQDDGSYYLNTEGFFIEHCKREQE